MQVASTAVPTVNGVYANRSGNPAVNGKFRAGQMALPWPDAAGTLHQFQTTAEWQAFATAMGDFFAAVDLGQTPSQPVTIP